MFIEVKERAGLKMCSKTPFKGREREMAGNNRGQGQDFYFHFSDRGDT